MAIDTPLAYPGKFDLKPVFTISSPNGNLVDGGLPYLTSQTFCSSVSKLLPKDQGPDGAGRGRGDGPVIVTTSPVGSFLAVTIIRENEEPTIFYLKMTEYKDIIAARAFWTGGSGGHHHHRSSSSEILLLLVDSSASLIRVLIPTSTYLPKSSHALSLTDFIDPSHPASKHQHLNPSMVDFVSSTVLVVAITPHLFSIDLHTHRAYPWSLSNAKTTTKAFFMFAAAGPVQNEPMKPVSALAVVDPKTVYTLDCAGLVHRWSLSGSQPDVSEHLLTNNHIPNPSYWRNPIFICGRSYHGVRVLAVLISNDMPVDDMPPSFDQSCRGASKNVICVIDELADGTVHAIRLQVPDGDVVSMEFDSAIDRCQLKVQFKDRLVLFRPSNVAMVSREPVVIHRQDNMVENIPPISIDYDGIRRLFWTPFRMTPMSTIKALERAAADGWEKLLAPQDCQVLCSKGDILVQRGCVMQERIEPPFLMSAVAAAAYVESSSDLLRLEEEFRNEVDEGSAIFKTADFKTYFTSMALVFLSELPAITFDTAVPVIPPPSEVYTEGEPGSQTQAAAWQLCIRYLHTISRLYLVRWLQVVRQGDVPRDVALRDYLAVLSALQVCFRHVDERHYNSVKRSKVEPVTVLDVLLHKVSAPNAHLLALAALNVILVPQGQGQTTLFPELAMLGENPDPYFALRLLAPSMLLPNVQGDVKRLVAQCLVRISQHHDEKAEAEILDRAFGILRLDHSDMDQFLLNLQVLENTIQSSAGFARLFAYVSMALALVAPTDPNFIILLSAKFNAACKRKDWLTAASTAKDHPTQHKEFTKRLVRTMVDSGALSDVIDRCNIKGEYGQTLFYDLAVEALAESYILQSDWYTSATKDRGDHLLALFAIHCTLQKWRSAAQVMGLRYKRAWQFLVTSRTNETLHGQALEDLVESSQLCLKSILQADENLRFIQEGKPDNMLYVAKGKCLTTQDLRNRVHNSLALRAIFRKQGTLGSLRPETGAEDSSVRVEDVFAKLCDCGLYRDALLFVERVYVQADHTSDDGYQLLRQLLVLLLSRYLIPLTGSTQDVMELSHMVDISELDAALSMMDVTAYHPTRSKRLGQLDRNKIRTGAQLLIQKVVVRYSTREVPLAMDTAKCMIHQGFTYLPTWLEDLLMFGHFSDDDLPGIFARRRPKDKPEGFVGDPAGLLDLYTKSGRLRRACHVVEAIMAGPKGDHRKNGAGSRRPEAGEMDFVPYHKIQFLHRAMTKRMQESQSRGYVVILKDMQKRLDDSLATYMKSLQISEQGLTSARTLRDDQ